MEKKLERMEEMLSSLISMVGNMNQKLQEMQVDFHEMKKEQLDMKNDIQTMQKENQSIKSTLAAMDAKNEAKFTEILNILTDIRAEQEHIWEKSARNERELAKLKFHLQL
ncbi:hypothetical protein ABES02_00205 [Neobacillus pocheonensis]|uniref:hypothetical protein n=1 Tax=Neobacillus pocheonensis TaxID=363869 RepID=UPI003D28DBD4